MIAFRDTAGKTPIYKAVMEGKNAMVKIMLGLISKVDELEDLSAKDGTTAFFIALGSLNAGKIILFSEIFSLIPTNLTTECAVAILESHLEPRTEIIFLARETMKIADNGDQRIANLKSSVGASLQSMFTDSESEEPAGKVLPKPPIYEDNRLTQIYQLHEIYYNG